MGISQLTPRQQIQAEIKKGAERIAQGLIKMLKYCGEKCVAQARDWQTHAKYYIDRTNNLRSSTGYVVTWNGNIVHMGGFTKAGSGKEGNGGQGKLQGKELAEKLAKAPEFAGKTCLIVVAGMEYAFHVANKGYDVLASAELLSDKIVPEMLAKLERKLAKR